MMRQLHKVIFLFFLSACLEPVDIDLPIGESRRVVYGWLSNVPEDCRVRLQWSNSFNDRNEYERITNATVYLSSTIGRVNFVEQSEKGLYLPESTNFDVNDFFQLWIVTEGDTLVSRVEHMNLVSPVDSVFSSFLVDPNSFDIPTDEPNYYISALINDDPSVSNFYRWEVFVNGQKRTAATELVLFDDLLTDGNRFRMDASNVLFTSEDSVSFRHLSLSESAYNYYLAIQLQTVNSTIEPNARPTNIVGNMRNITQPEQEVFGFFGVSDVQIVERVPVSN